MDMIDTFKIIDTSNVHMKGLFINLQKKQEHIPTIWFSAAKICYNKSSCQPNPRRGFMELSIQ